MIKFLTLAAPYLHSNFKYKLVQFHFLLYSVHLRINRLVPDLWETVGHLLALIVKIPDVSWYVLICSGPHPLKVQSLWILYFFLNTKKQYFPSQQKNQLHGTDTFTLSLLKCSSLWEQLFRVSSKKQLISKAWTRILVQSYTLNQHPPPNGKAVLEFECIQYKSVTRWTMLSSKQSLLP